MRNETRSTLIRRQIQRWLAASALVFVMAGYASASGTISGADKYAWSENAGWLNLRPGSGGVTVEADHLTGYAWHENLGWIKFGSATAGPYLNTTATNWGVNRDAGSNLSGYAWSETAGWINFNPTGGGVTIDPATGDFSGHAWGESIGWMSFRSPNGAAVSYGVGLASYTLTLAFDGAGGGSVTSISPPFSCNTGCTKTLFEVTPLTLTASPESYSLLGTWAGCDTATGADCVMTLDRDRNATVTFTKDTGLVTRIDGPTPSYYPTLQQAYDNAQPGSVIQAWGIDLPESLVCGASRQVTIKGGYDQQFQNRTGQTTVRGLVIGKGTVIVDMIVVK